MGGTIQIRLNNVDGPLVSEVEIPKSSSWITVIGKMSKFEKGVHDLVVVLKDANPVEVDWLRFEN